MLCLLQAQQVRENLRSVQVQLSETSNLYIAQGDKLREVRRTRMELDQENTSLKTTLNRTKVSITIMCICKLMHVYTFIFSQRLSYG